MNIQKYLLPVSIAATLHVALLCSFEDKPIRIITKFIEVPLPPLPKPDDVVTLPPEEKDPASVPVKSLPNAPTPPEIPDLPVTHMPDAIPVPMEPNRVSLTTGIKALPKIFGSDLTGINGPGDGPGIQVFSPGQLDHVPHARVQRSPDYPSALKQLGVGGSVTVEFDVDREGRVIRAEATSYTHREFVEPALRAVRSWRFEPGRRDGQVVPFRMAVPIEFGIEAS